jgi:hypothetical protein
MQLSLSYTTADLDDILPPGSYKLDLVDRSSMPLGLTIDVEIGSLRNAGPGESQDLDDGSVALTAGASDVRYLLEANVRSTQLAFQHNQRTLEAGLRVADTLREGIQALAETQADWIKSLVASRGYFRNSAMPQLAALPAPTEPEVEDDDAEEAPPNDRLMELGLGVVTMVNNLFAKFSAPAAAKSDASPKSDATTKFDLRSMLDWRHAAKQGDAARSSLGSGENAPSPKTPAELMAALPPDLVRKLLEVRAQLSADEQSRLMQLISAMPPDELPGIAAALESMPTDELLATVRNQLATPVKGE